MTPDTQVRMASYLEALSGGSPRPVRDRVADGLRRAIALRLFDEQKLPPERQLAEMMGVSRLTIRESLEQLRDEGTIRPVRGRHGGNYIVPTAERGKDLHALLDAAREEIADIQAFRSIVESEAARIAAERRSASLQVDLEASIGAMESNRDPDAFRRSDSAFHVRLAEATGNQRLLHSILAARADFLRWRDLLPMPDDIDDNVAMHRQIASAIEQGMPQRAASLMTQHLEDVRTSMWRGFDVYRGRTADLPLPGGRA